jgi:hypothetical protein
LLPEDQPGTFTYLLTRYLRPRPALELRVEDGQATGRLTEADGTPLGDASIELSYVPSEGESPYHDFVLEGVVPEAATRADVGLRINMECNCSGPARIRLGSVTYRQEGEGGSRVPNPGFSNGLDGWGLFGGAAGRLEPGEGGAGRALLLDLAPGQPAGLNSGLFEVTPGVGFVLTFRARVDPPTSGSGYFDIIFQNDRGEVGRLTIPIEVPRIGIGSTRTEEDGSFSLTLPPLPAGAHRIRAWFGGSDSLWPAAAEQPWSP